MTAFQAWPVAIIGSGNIGTDLMIKILRSDGPLTVGAMVGIDPDSDGLARARRMGVPTTAAGVDGLLDMPDFGDIKVVFDATSAHAHRANWATLRPRYADARPHAGVDRSVLRAGGQPRSAPGLPQPQHGHLRWPGHRAYRRRRRRGRDRLLRGDRLVDLGEVRRPGTRANIDEFIETTTTALQVVGGAQRAKAVMILNPADPPIIMRNTVYCLVDGDRSIPRSKRLSSRWSTK